MLGNDRFKTEVNCELSNERLKSLVFFYGPLIGNDALRMYEYLVLKGSAAEYRELNELLRALNISVDQFENECRKLNEYHLLKTLKKDDSYIFVISEPLSMRKFIADDILVRHFIMKAGGEQYHNLLAEIPQRESHAGYENVSEVLQADELNSWTADYETYLQGSGRKSRARQDYGTLFNVDRFLKGMSSNLLPLRFRTDGNLRKIARLGDLYNVSEERMCTFIPKVVMLDSDSIDFDLLTYKCANSTDEPSLKAEGYSEPSLTFLMKLQNGKKVTETDKYMLKKLMEEYELSIPVINVLLEFILNKYDNTIIPGKVYTYANNLHRNDIRTVEEAKKWLEESEKKTRKKNVREDIIPTYDTSTNPEFDEEKYRKIMESRKQK